MVKAVAERLHAAAVYGMPDILWNMIDIAQDKANKECTKAARFVGEVAGAISKGGVNVQNTVVTPLQSDMPDEILMEQVERVFRRRVPPDAP